MGYEKHYAVDYEISAERITALSFRVFNSVSSCAISHYESDVFTLAYQMNLDG